MNIMNNSPIPTPENTAFLTSEYPQYNETTEEAIAETRAMMDGVLASRQYSSPQELFEELDTSES
ncbi:hypothetical protein [Rothia aeria]